MSIYENKEEARLALRDALSTYKEAAEAYDYDIDDMVGEINDCLEGAEFEDLALVHI